MRRWLPLNFHLIHCASVSISSVVSLALSCEITFLFDHLHLSLRSWIFNDQNYTIFLSRVLIKHVLNQSSKILCPPAFHGLALKLCNSLSLQSADFRIDIMMSQPGWIVCLHRQRRTWLFRNEIKFLAFILLETNTFHNEFIIIVLKTFYHSVNFISILVESSICLIWLLKKVVRKLRTPAQSPLT